MTPLRSLPALAALLLVLAAPVAGAADQPVLSVAATTAGLDQQTSGGFAPPDVQVAAGPGYVVEMVNLELRIWRVSGGRLTAVSTDTLADFFRVGDDLSDPRILYDTQSGRWFASITTIDGDSVLLATSASADPTGDWTVTGLDAPGCADQPRLGTSDGLVVVAADVFSNCASERFARARGAELWLLSKADLLAGSTAPAQTTYGPTLAYSSLTPAHSLSSTATEYAVSLDDGASSVLHVLALAGAPPNVTVREVATPAIRPVSTPPNATEPTGAGGGVADVLTNDSRVLDAIWESGRLWFSANTGCVPTGTTETHACGRIAELATPAGTVTWQTDLSYPGADVFFPSLRPDGAGDVVAVYGRSSATQAPSVEAVARTSDGTFSAPVVLAQSAGPAGGSNGGRWGDYFGSSRDPRDPALVWVAGQTVDDEAEWTTTVAAVTLGAAPPVVAASGPPAVKARPARGTPGRPVRLSFLALGNGSGIRRKVTVNGLGKVVFATTTKPGPVHAQQAYSVVWKPAKTRRGRFRFCVRFVAADGTQSPASCAFVTLR
ncbi:MAG TPA: hypothetical protein VFJ77_00485 [Gaiellaceae bacterium]|nr:hypothetical protein [Gaiellaceae bacterium]